MAKGRRKNGKAVEVIGSNGFKVAEVQAFADRIARLEGEAEQIMDDAKNEVAVFKDDIKAVFDEAKDKGIPTKELKLALRKKKLYRQAEQLTLKCTDPESREQFDLLCEALNLNSEPSKVAYGGFENLPDGDETFQ